MKTRSVFLTVCLMLFTLKTFAGSVDVAQWIPWNFLSSEIFKAPLQFSSPLTAVTLNFGEWTPRATGAKYQVQGAISQLQFSPSGVQTTANLSAKVSVGELSIDQTIVREFNGNQIQIRIQAVCQPFEIQISDFTATAFAGFARQKSSWSPVLSNLALQIPQGSWSVSPLSCQGPQGLDAKIIAQIQDALSNPASLQEYLKAYLAPQIQGFWNSAWSQLSEPAWQNLKVDSMGDPNEKGFYLFGHLEIKNSAVVPLPAQLDPPTDEALHLYMTTEGFAALAQDHLSDLNVENYNLQNVPEFSKLTHSRFLQFFVWPDLLNYSRDVPVYISNLKAENKMSLSPAGAGNWRLTLQTRGVIQIPRQGAIRNYINWGMGMASNLKTDVRDSQLLLTTTGSNTNLNWAFDPDYVRQFHPASWLSSSILKKATQSLFENRSLQMPLPVLNWKGRDLKLNGWRQQGNLIELGWH